MQKCNKIVSLNFVILKFAEYFFLINLINHKLYDVMTITININCQRAQDQCTIGMYGRTCC